jgi:hypothetical protein
MYCCYIYIICNGLDFPLIVFDNLCKEEKVRDLKLILVEHRAL